jgi:Big-like domain-containing protein
LPKRLVFTLLCLLTVAAPPAAASPRAALRKAEAVMQGDGVKTGLEVTPALKELAAHLSGLHGSDHARARRLLERPVPGQAQQGESSYTVPEHPPFCSAHFCIHWVPIGPDAPPLATTLGSGIPDYIRTMDQVFEHVYQVENVQLGWRPPNGDGTRGGGLDKVDVYVKDVGGEGIFGYSTPDPGQHGHSQAAYLVMDNDYSHAQFPRYTSYLAPMQVTAAHEYNHVIQFGYDVLEDTWFLESTAVWMEDRVYDDVNDYLSYVGPWTQISQVPLTYFNDLDDTDPMNVKAYGDAVWNRWLEAHYGQELIRNAWERSAKTVPASFAPGAYDAALSARGSSFFGAFIRFAADSAEWHSTPAPFRDRDASIWPDVARASQRSLAPGSKPILGHLDHTSYALVNVTPTPDARIKIVGSLPRGTAGALALVGRRGPEGSGSVQVAMTKLRHGGSGSVALADPARFSRITAVLINADTTSHGYSRSTGAWIFDRNNQRVRARVSNRFAPLRLRSGTPGSGARVSPKARVVLRFSAAVSPSSLRSIRLRDSHGKRVAIRIRRGHGGSRLTLVPRRRLAAGARYSVELGSRIVDVDGNGLAPGQRGWTFRTR